MSTEQLDLFGNPIPAMPAKKEKGKAGAKASLPMGTEGETGAATEDGASEKMEGAAAPFVYADNNIVVKFKLKQPRAAITSVDLEPVNDITAATIEAAIIAVEGPIEVKEEVAETSGGRSFEVSDGLAAIELNIPLEIVGAAPTGAIATIDEEVATEAVVTTNILIDLEPQEGTEATEPSVEKEDDEPVKTFTELAENLEITFIEPIADDVGNNQQPSQETGEGFIADNCPEEPVTISLANGPSAEEPIDFTIETLPVTLAAKPLQPTNTNNKRGRKSYKELEIGVDLIHIPDDATLNKKLYYGITEVAGWFNVNVSQIRFWENEFDILQPRKTKKGDRLFRVEDIKNLQLIYHLIRQKKFSLEGAKAYLKSNKHEADVNYEVVQSLTKFRYFLLELKANLGV